MVTCGDSGVSCTGESKQQGVLLLLVVLLGISGVALRAKASGADSKGAGEEAELEGGLLVTLPELSLEGVIESEGVMLPKPLETLGMASHDGSSCLELEIDKSDTNCSDMANSR